MYIFNPEHDLCLANGDPNFVPPESALVFGRDCEGLTEWIEPDQDEGRIIPWGWDAVLKRRLEKAGIPESGLPSEQFLKDVRELSHRRVALSAGAAICNAVPAKTSGRFLPGKNSAILLTSVDDIVSYVNHYHDAVAKAPWSGSGKGLHWLRAGEVSGQDIGWCKNILAKQGSIVLECRRKVVQDFAMLFHVGTDTPGHGDNSNSGSVSEKDKVAFEGFSLFFTENGMYRGNILASDGHILAMLCRYVPESLIMNIRNALTSFLTETFVGKYVGYIGVDMFVYEDSAEHIFKIAPCVEINVRMTMGLLARRIYDLHLGKMSEHTVYDKEASDPVMTVKYNPHSGILYNTYIHDIMGGRAVALNKLSPSSRYAILISL